MNNLKIALFGFDNYVSQLPRYREAFLEMGHELNFKSPDIIYSNDPTGYNGAIKLKSENKKALLILHFLDIPWHLPNAEKQTKLLADNYLIKADIVAANSEKVKKDLYQFIPNKKIHVTYDIAKDVYLDTKIKKNNKFLYVGRANDPIKRIGIVHDVMKNIPDAIKSIKICGSENPGFGNYLGIVPDEELNKLYNSSYYVLLPSKAEGIGLPMIEGMICGSIPITCSDNLTAREFSPIEFICNPDPQSIVNKIIDLDKDYENKRKIALQYGEKYKVQFNKKNIAKNIINLFNFK
jgi:glycosyltransferase involved in cell wall biosynthesis